jgi:hypothetical protein
MDIQLMVCVGVLNMSLHIVVNTYAPYKNGNFQLVGVWLINHWL